MSDEVKKEEDLFTPSQPTPRQIKHRHIPPLSPDETDAMIKARAARRMPRIQVKMPDMDMSEIKNALHWNFDDLAAKIGKRVNLSGPSTEDTLKNLVKSAMDKGNYAEAKVLIKALSKLPK